MKFDDLLKEIRNLNDFEYNSIIEILTEEQRIITYNINYQFYIYREPLGNPSFHIVNKPKEIHTAFDFRTFSILERKSKKQYSNKEIKEIKEWLKESDNTRIKYLVDAWNEINPKYLIKYDEIKW